MSYCTFLDNRDVKKTRKDHQCEWCAETINKGESAHKRAYIFEGDFNTGYMHPECRDAMNEMEPLALADGFNTGDFKRGSQEER